MSAVQIFAVVTLAAWFIGACVVAVLNHGKRLPGYHNCKPVIFAAVIEAVLIALAVWGIP